MERTGKRKQGGGGKRPATLRAQHQAIVAERLAVGKRVSDIARELELDYTTVRKDAIAVEARWQAEAMVSRKAFKNQRMLTLRIYQDELWNAWQASKGDREITVEDVVRTVRDLQEAAIGAGVPKKEIPSSSMIKRSHRREKRDPEVAYMNALLKIVAIELEIMGISNLKHEEDKAQPMLVPNELEQMTDVELSAFTQEMLSKANALQGAGV